MLKKSVFTVIALGAMQFVNAQTVDSVVTKEVQVADKYVVQTNYFKHNWFVGAQVGAQVLFGDHCRQMDFVDRISPAFEVNFGKWFTPSIGARFSLSGLNVKGVSGWGTHGQKKGTNQQIGNPNNGNWSNRVYGGFLTDGRDIDEAATKRVGYAMYKTNMKYVHAQASLMFNLSQMINGYKSDRFYSFIPYASLGFIHSLNKPIIPTSKPANAIEGGLYTREVTAGLGLLNSFKVSDRLDVNLDIRATYAGDRMDQQVGDRWGEGILQAYLGLSYDLGKNDWKPSTVTTIRVNENVLADLRERVGDLELTNDDLRQQLEGALNREVTEANICGMPLLVTFRIDHWDLSNKDRVNLGFLAKAIKANPNMIYNIIGYADRGTGSVRRNVFLARKRAEVIYNCLVKEFGVSESQLTKDSKGGVANMYYNDPRCSRSVLLKIAE